MAESQAKEEEIFEINDFTNATPWETFVADIEKVLRQWGLADTAEEPTLDPHRQQHCKSEQLQYAGRRFIMKLEVSGDGDSHAHSTEEPNRQVWSTAMFEMMDRQGDFPPSSHPIARWYGVKEFIIIAPEKGVEALSSQAQAKLMLSSASIAVANTHCSTPIFIQIQQQWRHMYVGVATGLGGGILVNFDMIHLKHVPSHFTHLSGLLDMFKAKIRLPSMPLEPVQIAVRYTYLLKHWSLEDWPVEPLSDVDGDEETTYWKELPVGPMSDPISELHLSAVWPNLSEETVIDRDTHTDLQPTHAPLWTVTAHLVDTTTCFLSESLHNFLKLCYHEESMDQLLKNYTIEEDGFSSPQPFSQALEKLTNQSVSSLGSPFLSSVVYSASQRLEFGLRGREGTHISDKKLETILKVLFPDAYELPADPVSGDQRGSLKSAPQGSLSRQLASTLSIINTENGLRAFAEVWNEVLQELRYRWDQGINIASLPDGPPDMGSCLLHQKLQMLNCCIKHKKLHEEQLQAPNFKTPQSHSQSSLEQFHSSSKLSRHKKTPSDSGSDEFYEALETQETDADGYDTGEAKSSCPSEANSGSKEESGLELDQDRVGVLRVCEDLVLVSNGKPLCIPVTQDHTPMTEDMMWEQQNVLARLGTSEEAAKVRAKMQSSSLLSDMQAFKAANPGCLLDDFVRWYSPRDWIQDENPSSPMSPQTPANPTSVSASPSSPSPSRPSSHHSNDRDVVEGTVLLEGRGLGADSGQSGGVESSSAGQISHFTVQEEGVEDKGGWADGEGWGTDDWDLIVEDEEESSPVEKEPVNRAKYVTGHLSDRMLQPDNVWLETWQSATPIPVHRQKRIFDDTKEAEKVLHFLAQLKPCELAMCLMPLLLHSAVERMKGRLRRQSLARVEGLLEDTMALLATVQQPSLDTLPLYQECISLLSQAERLLAAAHSLRGKLRLGLEVDRGHGNVISPDASAELAVGAEVMLEAPELIIKDPLKSPVGVAMKGLLTTQNAMQVQQDLTQSGQKFRQPVLPPHATTFPQPTWREFILRSAVPFPSPHSQVVPQRMFCVLQPGMEFRVAGAFARDSNFQ